MIDPIEISHTLRLRRALSIWQGHRGLDNHDRSFNINHLTEDRPAEEQRNRT